jgi:hypothetical protein
MRKIKLNLERLNVESFATDDARAKRGTVRAHNSFDFCGTDSPNSYSNPPADCLCVNSGVELVCSGIPSCPGQPTCGGEKSCAC